MLAAKGESIIHKQLKKPYEKSARRELKKFKKYRVSKYSVQS